MEVAGLNSREGRGGGCWKGAELTAALSPVGFHRVPPVSTATRFQLLAPECIATQTQKQQPDSWDDVFLFARSRDGVLLTLCFSA